MSRLLTLLLLFCSLGAAAQTGGIRGAVLDGGDGSPLTGGTAALLSEQDSTFRKTVATDADGLFEVTGLAVGRYLLRVTYASYTPSTQIVKVDTALVVVDTIRLQPGENTIGTVEVRGAAVQAQVRGDTLEFDARAFKVNPDATAEDLISKMPGVTNDGTGLKVNGETVQRVLVDGKPFFGDDPSAALRNLPAEAVGKVQIHDRRSDQARFTGFDDGNAERTINIVTRDGKNRGLFGRAQAGYGPGGAVREQGASILEDGRYNINASLNFFRGARRISVLGMTNNVNQQNFNIDDLVGAMTTGQSGGGSRGGGMMGMGGRGGGGNGFGGSGSATLGGGGNFGNFGNFFVGQQNGISTTKAGGLNYTDQWGKKVSVTGSYFFNQTDNEALNSLKRQFILAGSEAPADDSTSLSYRETNRTSTRNINHRANLRIEYSIDSNNELFIIPRVSFQDNRTVRSSVGISSLAERLTTSQVTNRYDARSTGMNLGNEITYRHRFGRPGRTVSIGLNTSYNTRDGDATIYTLSETLVGDSLSDQQVLNESTGTNLSANVSYTEPMGRRGQVLVTYQPSLNINSSDRYAYEQAAGSGEYTDLNTTLSNVFDNRYTQQRGGAGYRFVDSLIEGGVTLNAQAATLTGTQVFPYALDVSRNFFDLLPQAQLQFKFTRTHGLRINYRTNTNVPSITQLQNVVDNSNPLQLRTGNANLRQDYTHNLFARYNKINIVTGRSLFGFASGSYTAYYIGNSTVTAINDTTVGDIFLARGAQLTQPVNLNGAANARAFLTYAQPIKALKSNLSLNGGVTYNLTPALINGVRNEASNYALNAGFTLGSNISENLDFSASVQSAYNLVDNSLLSASNFNYYSQNTFVRLNYIFLKGVVFNTEIRNTLYAGLGDGFNQNFTLWNASLGYKWGKSKALQTDIYVFDILKQNNAISRTVEATYIEDNQTNVLQRYGMLRITYTLRRFQGRTQQPEPDIPPVMRMMRNSAPIQGMPGPGGG